MTALIRRTGVVSLLTSVAVGTTLREDARGWMKPEARPRRVVPWLKYGSISPLAAKAGGCFCLQEVLDEWQSEVSPFLGRRK
jgi:hypothetical protein